MSKNDEKEFCSFLLADEVHLHKVMQIAIDVLNRPAGSLLGHRKNVPNHQLREAHPHDEQPVYRVDVDGLKEVLYIDQEFQLAYCEALVTMEQLCTATLAVGFLPTVVPEYRSFTVSGLVNGDGVQSSCHKYGTFGVGAVMGVEMVEGDGTIVFATRTCEEGEVRLGEEGGGHKRVHVSHNEDLLAALCGSHGTMGIVTAVAVKLRKAEPYVHSLYHHFSTRHEYVEKLTALALPCVSVSSEVKGTSEIGRKEEAVCDFLDAVVFSATHYTIVESWFCSKDEAIAQQQPWTEAYHPLDEAGMGEEWYYQYARHTRKRGIQSDVIATREFVHRSERGAYWAAEFFVNFPALTNSRRGRRMVDKEARELEKLYGFKDNFLSPAEAARCYVMQDLGVYLSRLEEVLVYVQEKLCIYPIWNCVIRLPHNKATYCDPARPNTTGPRLIVDVGLYGEPGIKHFQHARMINALQRTVDFPSLWGQCYLTRDEMRDHVYDRPTYLKLRKKYKVGTYFQLCAPLPYYAPCFCCLVCTLL